MAKMIYAVHSGKKAVFDEGNAEQIRHWLELDNVALFMTDAFSMSIIDIDRGVVYSIDNESVKIDRAQAV